MTQSTTGPDHATRVDSADPPSGRFRWTFVAVEAFVTLGAVAGAWQLWTGTFVPPVSDLEPLGLDSWRLPAVWLFGSVAVPSGIACAAAWTRRPWTPEAVLVAAILLLVEVTVQIPFVGPSVLQAVMGTIAVVLGVLALVERRSDGWRLGATAYEECPECHAELARSLAVCDSCGYDLVRSTKAAHDLRGPV